MKIDNSSDSYQKLSEHVAELCAKIKHLEEMLADHMEQDGLQNAEQNRRLSAISYATGVLGESSVNLLMPDEWKEMLTEFDISPTCVLMTGDTEDIDRQLYEETIKRGFLTTSDVMHMLSFSRPGAIRAMRRSADLHADLIFAKRKTRNNSARRVWILEHTEHMSTVAVNGFRF
jgi:hypothetical protein